MSASENPSPLVGEGGGEGFVKGFRKRSLSSPSSSWFEREIAEQPVVLRRVVDEWEAPLRRWWASAPRRPDIIVCVGRGSSLHASVYAQYLLQTEWQLPVMIALPSVGLWYRKSWPLKRAWVIGLSQSGETPDIVEAFRDARRHGAYTIALTNRGASPLAKTAHATWVTPAGEEKAIPTSKTYTAQLMMLALWAALGSRKKTLRAQLEQVPRWTEDVVRRADILMKRARTVPLDRGCVVVGRGFQLCAALETAIKIREVSRILAVGLSTMEFLHTSAALGARQFPLVTFEARGVMSDHLRHVERAARASRLPTLWVTNRSRHSQGCLSYPADVPEWLSPIPSVVAGQLIALSWGRKLGWDVDGGPALPKVTRVR